MKAIVRRMIGGQADNRPGLGTDNAAVISTYKSVKTLTRYYLDRFKRDGYTYQVEVFYGDNIYGRPELTLLYTDGHLRRAD